MEREGSKEKVLVFLHYFGGSAQSWKWVIEQLSSDYRCIAISFPGFGKLAPLEKPSIQGFADHVRKELEALGLISCVLVGHSMGGKIAVEIAADTFGKTVQQLILVAPSPPTTEPMPKEEKERMLHHPNREEALRTVLGAVKRPLEEDKTKLAVDTQLLIDEATWRWWLLEGMDDSIYEKAVLLDLPVTVLASEDDPVITPQVIRERVMKVLKQARLINTRGVGHLIPLEDPDWVAAQIREILEDDSGAPDHRI